MRVRVVTLRRAPACIEAGHRSCERRRTPVLLWATTALPISAATYDARARARAAHPLPREAVASVRVPRRNRPLARCPTWSSAAPCGVMAKIEEPCRLSVPSARLSRGALAPFGSVGALACGHAGKREELIALRREQHGRDPTERRRYSTASRRGDLPLLVRESQHPRVTGPQEAKVGDLRFVPGPAKIANAFRPPAKGDGRRATRVLGSPRRYVRRKGDRSPISSDRPTCRARGLDERRCESTGPRLFCHRFGPALTCEAKVKWLGRCPTVPKPRFGKWAHGFSVRPAAAPETTTAVRVSSRADVPRTSWAMYLPKPDLPQHKIDESNHFFLPNIAHRVFHSFSFAALDRQNTAEIAAIFVATRCNVAP